MIHYLQARYELLRNNYDLLGWPVVFSTGMNELVWGVSPPWGEDLLEDDGLLRQDGRQLQ